ncbi:alpha/beta hydrolase [Parendozoicomonas sp. Alg238-R29]|uniref:alpha/beta fold hydrolase n=1 Tax=Parendozoicomonas sp. Alg238-R29 TaxID=2993446 RepID=UPI00248D86C7|nr:alpha/beta hydrolase [Parendozoicomonas sp. Alg238-R29]
MAITYINGYPLFYRLVGTQTQQPPIVLIHGLASSHKDWLLQMPTLCRSRQVVLVDLPGHGRSGYRSPPSVQAMADDIHRLLQQLNIKLCDVMGISMGGMVAMSLAAARPALIQKLILVNTAPSLHDVIRPIRYLLPLHNLLAYIPAPVLAKILLHNLLPGKQLAAVRHHAQKYWQKNNPRIIAEILKQLTFTNLWPQVADIRAKTLMIRGQHDTFTLSAALRICQTIPKARLITIRDSGHATIVDKHARFNEILQQFLEEKNKVKFNLGSLVDL